MRECFHCKREIRDGEPRVFNEGECIEFHEECPPAERYLQDVLSVVDRMRAAERVQVIEALEGADELLRKLQATFTDYLSHQITSKELVSRTVGLLDGPEQRVVQSRLTFVLTQLQHMSERAGK